MSTDTTPKTPMQEIAYGAGCAAAVNGHRRWAPSDHTSDFMRWWFIGYDNAARTTPASTTKETR